MAERQGRYTLILPSKPSIHGSAAVAGKTKGEGPLAEEFKVFALHNRYIYFSK